MPKWTGSRWVQENAGSPRDSRLGQGLALSSEMLMWPGVLALGPGEGSGGMKGCLTWDFFKMTNKNFFPVFQNRATLSKNLNLMLFLKI